VLVPWKRLGSGERAAPNGKTEYAGCRRRRAQASYHAHRNDLSGKHARREKGCEAIPPSPVDWVGASLSPGPAHPAGPRALAARKARPLTLRKRKCRPLAQLFSPASLTSYARLSCRPVIFTVGPSLAPKRVFFRTPHPRC